MFKKSALRLIPLFALSSIIFFPLTAQAQLITFGPAITSGSGCKPGQPLFISPDGRTISILLENFVAENGKRANCVIRIPTTVSPGFLVKSVDVTYRGFRDIAPGGKGFLKSTYSLGAQTAPGVNANFTEGTGIFTETAPFTLAAFFQCGFQDNLGINMNAYASKDSTVILDSIVTLTFVLERCN